MRIVAMKEEIYYINQNSDTKELIRLAMCGITYPDKSYRINRQNSHIFCIEYIEEGSGTVHIDNKTFYPAEGDSYFLQAGKDQRYYSDRKTPWKKYFINFSGRLAESLTEGYGLSDTSHFEALDLKSEMTRIIELGKSDSDRSEEIILILNEIFLKMYAHSISKKEHTIEEKMREYLNSQTTSKFRIEDLCRHVNRSESQTIRIFKKAFGITPYNYTLERKIDLAKKLLCDTNLSIKEISEKLCFADEYYFSNIFKKKVGFPPSEYRKKN